MKASAQQYIEELKLVAHREGGYFVRIYHSDNRVQALAAQYGENNLRSAGTCIYYLLEKNDFSAWHKLKSDEIWHFCDGALLKLYILDVNGNLIEKLLGAPQQNVNASFQIAIPAGDWFAAELVDKQSFCLVTCTVFPGFEYEDFELADRQKLSAQFPQHAALINKFTRNV